MYTYVRIPFTINHNYAKYIYLYKNLLSFFNIHVTFFNCLTSFIIVCVFFTLIVFNFVLANAIYFFRYIYNKTVY